MKKIIIITISLIGLLSCDKTYTITFFSNNSSIDGEREEIKAKNDSIAYGMAAQAFQIRQMSAKEMLKGGSVSDFRLTNFLLHNSEGKLVLPPDFTQEELWLLDLGCRLGYEKVITEKNRDRIDELLKNFDVSKDEYDSKQPIWYIPKTRSLEGYGADILLNCYFAERDGEISNFRFGIYCCYKTYRKFEPKRFLFLIDSQPEEFYPMDVSKISVKKKEGGYYIEYSEPVADMQSASFVKSIIDSKCASLKIVGDNDYTIFTIDEDSRQAMSNAIQLYKEMGGLL